MLNLPQSQVDAMLQQFVKVNQITQSEQRRHQHRNADNTFLSTNLTVEEEQEKKQGYVEIQNDLIRFDLMCR